MNPQFNIPAFDDDSEWVRVQMRGPNKDCVFIGQGDAKICFNKKNAKAIVDAILKAVECVGGDGHANRN